MRTTLLRLATTVLFISGVSRVMGVGFAGLFVTRTEVTAVQICWNSEPDHLYQLQRSATLSADDWADLGFPMTGTGGTVCVDDPVSVANAFYRAREVSGETNGAVIFASIRISEVRMCWETATNLIYQLQYRSELTSNVWTDLGPPRAATEPRTCDRVRLIDPYRDYRLVGPDVVWVPPGTFLMGSPTDEPGRSSIEGPQTTAVGSYAPNGWGLYDLHGNLWEWCQDWYGTYPGGSVADPKGPATGSSRVIRGGSWNYYAVYCRSAHRNWFYPPNRATSFGFRIVLAPGQP